MLRHIRLQSISVSPKHLEIALYTSPAIPLRLNSSLVFRNTSVDQTADLKDLKILNTATR